METKLVKNGKLLRSYRFQKPLAWFHFNRVILNAPPRAALMIRLRFVDQREAVS